MVFVYGIIGLGIIVIVHEFGHFIAAKAFGVKVESFSVGMGPVLLHKTFKGTDYRLSLIPLGGYCGMKGEDAFQKAVESNASEMQDDPDGFYGVHPLKRATIAFGGPFFNVIFAVIAYTIISMIGYTYYTSGNQVVLASELYPDSCTIAEAAGLATGDRIISINGKPTPYFSDISEAVSLNAKENISVEVQRNGQILHFSLVPEMETSTGAGKIGITNWIDPYIFDVEPGSPAEKAGLSAGDLILEINGNIILNSVDVQKNTRFSPRVKISVERNGQVVTKEFDTSLNAETGTYSLGISFGLTPVQTNVYSFFPAIWQGIKETANLIGMTFKSLGLLFKGVDVSNAVSGPIRITKMLGDTAEAGFSAGFSVGLISVLQLLSLISISLFIMNLLPIPILDGGLILFALIQWIRKKQIRPNVLYKIQFVGIGIIALIFVFAFVGDIRYLFTK
ncbi:MAG: RIP metalloprotease RseP [Treponemataceae bacterium]|nr:RIP metalloprotease RseP [Treponemataceae bacterium]